MVHTLAFPSLVAETEPIRDQVPAEVIGVDGVPDEALVVSRLGGRELAWGETEAARPLDRQGVPPLVLCLPTASRVELHRLSCELMVHRLKLWMGSFWHRHIHQTMIAQHQDEVFHPCDCLPSADVPDWRELRLGLLRGLLLGFESVQQLGWLTQVVDPADVFHWPSLLVIPCQRLLVTIQLDQGHSILYLEYCEPAIAVPVSSTFFDDKSLH